jgi:hypothetical protein
MHPGGPQADCPHTFCRDYLSLFCDVVVGLQVRAMLAVPYFEKALYELPEDQLTVDTLLALADEIEVRPTHLCATASAAKATASYIYLVTGHLFSTFPAYWHMLWLAWPAEAASCT